MSKPLISLRQLREQYRQGINIMAYLRDNLGIAANTPEIILQSYDLQAGSYVEGFFEIPETSPGKKYRREVAETLSRFPAVSLMEAGIGEATTLYYTAQKFPRETKMFGFDISWSRLAVAHAFLQKQGIDNVSLCTGDLFSIPLPDQSIDLVYTSHSIEPNGGREREILAELFRVTRRWLVLFEPSSELGSDATRRRIEEHGYCRELVAHARALGLNVTEHRLIDNIAREDNQTAIIVIEKKANGLSEVQWACPCCQSVLKFVKGHLYCQECLSVYPVLAGIPCLLPSNAIVATLFDSSLPMP